MLCTFYILIAIKAAISQKIMLIFKGISLDLLQNIMYNGICGECFVTCIKQLIVFSQNVMIFS